MTFADVPEALTFGADEEEALMHTVDALETALSFYVESRSDRQAMTAHNSPAAPC